MIDREKVKEAIKPMKDDVRALIDKYASMAAELSPNSTDPHSPVLAFMQMALAQAAVEYMLVCGCTLPEAVQATVTVTGRSMEAWVRTLMRGSTPDVQPVQKLDDLPSQKKRRRQRGNL
jgi:hypothetical protein